MVDVWGLVRALGSRAKRPSDRVSPLVRLVPGAPPRKDRRKGAAAGCRGVLGSGSRVC